jgi:hypothetical protein
MDIRKFSPQTQQTLRRLDFNQDQQLSARELNNLTAIAKQGKPIPGIAPTDQNAVQKALLETPKGAPVIVGLVDDNDLFSPPAKPLFADPSVSAPKASAEPRRPGKVIPAAADATLKVTPKMKAAQEGEPGKVEGVALQATSPWGSLKLEGKGLEAAPPKGKKQPPPPSVQNFKPVIPGQPAETEAMPTERFDLRGEAALGSLKLKAQAQLDAQQQLGNVTTGVELQVLPGHGLKAQAKPPVGTNAALSWSAVEVGSTHKLGALSLNTKANLDAQGRPSRYGAGVAYEIMPGAQLEAEADSTRNVRVGGRMRFSF